MQTTISSVVALLKIFPALAVTTIQVIFNLTTHVAWGTCIQSIINYIDLLCHVVWIICTVAALTLDIDVCICIHLWPSLSLRVPSNNVTLCTALEFL
jgi:hypothetical protein